MARVSVLSADDSLKAIDTEATEIAWAYRIALYDAAYVAVAERLGLPLLTEDEVMTKEMMGHSIVVRLDVHGPLRAKGPVVDRHSAVTAPGLATRCPRSRSRRNERS